MRPPSFGLNGQAELCRGSLEATSMSTATVGASPNNTPVSRGNPAEKSRTRPSSFISFLFIRISIDGKLLFAEQLVLCGAACTERSAGKRIHGIILVIRL